MCDATTKEIKVVGITGIGKDLLRILELGYAPIHTYTVVSLRVVLTQGFLTMKLPCTPPRWRGFFIN